MKAKYRIGMYLLLAEALKEPSQEWLDEQEQAFQYIQEAITVLGYPVELIKDWPCFAGSLTELQKHYVRSFVFPLTECIVPVESIFRQWTFDQTSELPFAKQKGYLMSDAAMHVKALFAQYGIEFPAEFANCPDHLCLELEFVAFLLEHESDECQKIFMKEHLDWIPELYQQAVEKSIPEYYLKLLGISSSFITYDVGIL